MFAFDDGDEKRAVEANVVRLELAVERLEEGVLAGANMVQRLGADNARNLRKAGVTRVLAHAAKATCRCARRSGEGVEAGH